MIKIYFKFFYGIIDAFKGEVVMEVKEIIEMEKRDYVEEKRILTKFSQILKSYISEDNIKRTLNNNGFNGVYLSDSKLFSLYNGEEASGIYDEEEKVIILNKEEYFNDKKMGIHEMCHAYLDGKMEKSIKFNEDKMTYGKGLEEGAATLLSCTSNVKNISKLNPFVYAYQSRLFQQLDVLYKYSDLKNYDNLLIHLLREPKNFIPLIGDIYENIYKTNYPDCDNFTILRSAFVMVAGTDLLTDCDDVSIYSLLNCINSIYLNVADPKMRRNEKIHPWFVNDKQLKQTSEDIFLEKLFGVNDGYYNRQLTNLNSSIVLLNEKFEQYDYEGKIKTK